MTTNEINEHVKTLVDALEGCEFRVLGHELYVITQLGNGWRLNVNVAGPYLFGQGWSIDWVKSYDSIVDIDANTFNEGSFVRVDKLSQSTGYTFSKEGPLPSFRHSTHVTSVTNYFDESELSTVIARELGNIKLIEE